VGGVGPGTRRCSTLITVDASSFVPPYEQIRAQIAAQIADGALVAGTRLPTVRRLAEDLGLAVNTVARAYRELEAAGLVETRGRGGTMVTAAGDQARERLQAAAQRYAALVHDVGLSADEALRIFRAALSP
jgi:DNA-binding transcriptional regulator YhcF (GntR family)